MDRTFAGTARHRESPDPAPKAGRRRRGVAPDPHPVAGRRRSGVISDSLRADATAAADIVASYSNRWASEQILEHAEIAALALTEARAQVPTAGRRRRPSPEAQVLDVAAAVLAQVHDQVAAGTASGLWR